MLEYPTDSAAAKFDPEPAIGSSTIPVAHGQTTADQPAQKVNRVLGWGFITRQAISLRRFSPALSKAIETRCDSSGMLATVSQRVR